jgi:hypothetical protein
VGGACSSNGWRRGTLAGYLIGKPEGKKSLGRPRHSWVDNVKMDLVEIEWSFVEWIGLTRDRDKWRAIVNAVMNFRTLYNVGKLSSGCTTRGLLGNAQLRIVS